MITVEKNHSSFANGQSFRIPINVFENEPSRNKETARVIAIVPDDINLTENSYFILNFGYGYVNYDSDVPLRMVNGPINSWLKIYNHSTSTTNCITYIKITKDGYIYSYVERGDSNYYYEMEQDLIITVYDEISDVLTDVINYQPDFSKITAMTNPTTAIFKSSNNLNLKCSMLTAINYGTNYRNRIYLKSPISDWPLTIKLTFSFDSSGSWYDVYNNATLILLRDNQTSYDDAIYCDNQLTPPQPGETVTYTFTLDKTNTWDSYFYIGFYSQDSVNGVATQYIQLQQIEILQDISLNGSFPPNNEELIQTTSSKDVTLYNQIRILEYLDSSNGTIIQNTI